MKELGENCTKLHTLFTTHTYISTHFQHTHINHLLTYCMIKKDIYKYIHTTEGLDLTPSEHSEKLITKLYFLSLTP